MDMAFKELARSRRKVFSHGKLIHNEPALELLAQKGLKTWNGEKGATVIIRAHGLAPDEKKNLQKVAYVRDATCPKVLQVQRLVSAQAALGRNVIVWGASDHPEVVGIIGHANGLGWVVKNPIDVQKLPPMSAVLLVAQTTQETHKWP
ncbi:MAG: 4-hydroxy-3-methylbut-2-enyl diphosphate reductase, partial [Candidatus Adiutrix sp.]